MLIESTNGEEDGTLTCSECGARGYKNLIRHLKSKHHMTPKDYLNKYPEDKVYTDEMRDKFSSGGYSANRSMKDKGFDFSERSRKARKTEIENDPEAFLKRNRSLFKDPDFKQRASDRIMNAKRWHGDRYRYNGNSFRSTWEVKFAKWLDQMNIKYEYESKKVKYVDPESNCERTYYPDFYLSDLNLCIEVKPQVYINNPSVKSKMTACLDQGYKFKFITQNELNNLSTDLLNV